MYEETIEALEKQTEELQEIIERLRRLGNINGATPPEHKPRSAWTAARRRKFQATMKKKRSESN